MHLQTASQEFLLHCRLEKNLSPKTLKAYQIDLNQVQAFLNSQIAVTDITKHDIRNYLESISTLKPKSVKRKIATLKALFNYLEFEDRILINPFRKMRIKIKEPFRLPTVMDIQDIVKIFKAGYRRKKEITDQKSYAYREAIRNIAVLELLFTTGARVSEIAGLKKENINLHTGIIIIKGKGNKERIIQICNKETIDLLQNYYSLFEQYIADSGGWFLVNRSNKKLSDQSIRNMVKKVARKAGLSKRITPHIFRHSFATLLLEKDVDIKYIQSLLGHSSINTTQIYTHVNRKRQRQILHAKHPRRDFSMVV
jgi:integrase/recombinase XerD